MNKSSTSCIFCGHHKVYKNGLVNGFQRYRCLSCKKSFSDSPNPVGGQRNPDEDAVILIVRRHHESGKSLREIADYLNTNGYKPKRGVKWYAMSVKILVDRIYA